MAIFTVSPAAATGAASAAGPLSPPDTATTAAAAMTASRATPPRMRPLRLPLPGDSNWARLSART